MRLGLTLSVSDAADLAASVALAEEADRLGFDSCWASEAYGYDAATVLATVAARTRRIGVGSGVFQIPARAPAMTAMTSATLDALSQGRFRLGLGVSGPQVSEGWYGVRFADPLGRTREYIDIVRTVLARKVLAHTGTHYTLPLPDGPGKALRLATRPVRTDIPIYLAAVGPRNLELAGEIADGWLGVFVSPAYLPTSLGYVRAGWERGARPEADRAAFDIVASVPVAVGDDVDACADLVRPYAALYLGGMGSRTQNFYNALAARMGYAEQAAQVQQLYLERRHRDAARAVPVEFLDETALLGPSTRIVERLRAYAEAGVTTLALLPFGQTVEDRVNALRTTAEAWIASGVGD